MNLGWLFYKRLYLQLHNNHIDKKHIKELTTAFSSLDDDVP